MSSPQQEKKRDEDSEDIEPEVLESEEEGGIGVSHQIGESQIHNHSKKEELKEPIIDISTSAINHT